MCCLTAWRDGWLLILILSLIQHNPAFCSRWHILQAQFPDLEIERFFPLSAVLLCDNFWSLSFCLRQSWILLSPTSYSACRTTAMSLYICDDFKIVSRSTRLSYITHFLGAKIQRLMIICNGVLYIVYSSFFRVVYLNFTNWFCFMIIFKKKNITHCMDAFYRLKL